MQCGVSGMFQMQDAAVLPCHWEQRIMCLCGGRGRYRGSILVCYCIPIERDGTPELGTPNNHAAKATHYEVGSVKLTTS